SAEGMAIPVLVDEVFCRGFTEGSKPLWAIWAHPDEVSGADGIPVVIEFVDTAALQHEQTVLHDMHLYHAESGTGLVGHGVDREVEGSGIGKEAADDQVGVSHQRLPDDAGFA